MDRRLVLLISIVVPLYIFFMVGPLIGIRPRTPFALFDSIKENPTDMEDTPSSVVVEAEEFPSNEPAETEVVETNATEDLRAEERQKGEKQGSDKKPKVVVILIDALRPDMLLTKHRFPKTHRLFRDGKMWSATPLARAPTVTLPKIKSITTGRDSVFVDLLFNFATTAIEDQSNVITAFVKKFDGKANAYGADTWMELFKDTGDSKKGPQQRSNAGQKRQQQPSLFHRAEGLFGCDVSDHIEIDLNLTRILCWEFGFLKDRLQHDTSSCPLFYSEPEDLSPSSFDLLSDALLTLFTPEVSSPPFMDSDFIIAHYLGLDHIGHTVGPDSVEMLKKYREMDHLVFTTYQYLSSRAAKSTKHRNTNKKVGEQEKSEEESFVLVVLSDHGMAAKGGHGGLTSGEVHSSLALSIIPAIPKKKEDEKSHLSEEGAATSTATARDEIGCSSNDEWVCNETRTALLPSCVSVYQGVEHCPLQELQQIDVAPLLSFLLGMESTKKGKDVKENIVAPWLPERGVGILPFHLLLQTGQFPLSELEVWLWANVKKIHKNLEKTGKDKDVLDRSSVLLSNLKVRREALRERRRENLSNTETEEIIHILTDAYCVAKNMQAHVQASADYFDFTADFAALAVALVFLVTVGIVSWRCLSMVAHSAPKATFFSKNQKERKNSSDNLRVWLLSSVTLAAMCIHALSFLSSSYNEEDFLLIHYFSMTSLLIVCVLGSLAVQIVLHDNDGHRTTITFMTACMQNTGTTIGGRRREEGIIGLALLRSNRQLELLLIEKRKKFDDDDERGGAALIIEQRKHEGERQEEEEGKEQEEIDFIALIGVIRSIFLLFCALLCFRFCYGFELSGTKWMWLDPLPPTFSAWASSVSSTYLEVFGARERDTVAFAFYRGLRQLLLVVRANFFPSGDERISFPTSTEGADLTACAAAVFIWTIFCFATERILQHCMMCPWQLLCGGAKIGGDATTPVGAGCDGRTSSSRRDENFANWKLRRAFCLAALGSFSFVPFSAVPAAIPLFTGAVLLEQGRELLLDSLDVLEQVRRIRSEKEKLKSSCSATSHCQLLQRIRFATSVACITAYVFLLDSCYYTFGRVPLFSNVKFDHLMGYFYLLPEAYLRSGTLALIGPLLFLWHHAGRVFLLLGLRVNIIRFSSSTSTTVWMKMKKKDEILQESAAHLWSLSTLILQKMCHSLICLLVASFSCLIQQTHLFYWSTFLPKLVFVAMDGIWWWLWLLVMCVLSFL